MIIRSMRASSALERQFLDVIPWPRLRLRQFCKSKGNSEGGECLGRRMTQLMFIGTLFDCCCGKFISFIYSRNLTWLRLKYVQSRNNIFFCVIYYSKQKINPRKPQIYRPSQANLKLSETLLTWTQSYQKQITKQAVSLNGLKSFLKTFSDCFFCNSETSTSTGCVITTLFLNRKIKHFHALIPMNFVVIVSK